MWIWRRPPEQALPEFLTHRINQFSSVAQWYPILCNPMDCSTLGLPVYHQLLELTQTHVHWVSDTMQPSHPLSSPSLPTLNFSQYQGLFIWISSSHQVAKVLRFQLQHQSFKWIGSDQISRSVVSDSLQSHESQHARPPCPSPTPGVHWDSRPSTQWCHPAISSSVVPFSSCPQSLPASESFPMSQLFTWGGQSTGVSALASFLPKLQIHTTFLILQAFIECKTPDPMPTDGDKKQTKYTGKL